ncbi:hypothetical protein [Variovorax paradoxus]|uniref:hypothetical protein n=1 Tax=Variovorax paradoxus TaxID=34073 RepID=UPI0019334C94|nr:hypothetical protein INQ48_13745 [Variovorax paradoxus]
MIRKLFSPFAPLTAERIARQQLQQAQQARLEHQAAAEHHKALADMYAAREQRLSQEVRA